MNDTADDCIQGWFPWVSGNLDVVKAVECEVRLEDLLTLTLEDICVSLPGGFEVLRIDRPIED